MDIQKLKSELSDIINQTKEALDNKAIANIWNTFSYLNTSKGPIGGDITVTLKDTKNNQTKDYNLTIKTRYRDLFTEQCFFSKKGGVLQPIENSEKLLSFEKRKEIIFKIFDNFEEKVLDEIKELIRNNRKYKDISELKSLNFNRFLHQPDTFIVAKKDKKLEMMNSEEIPKVIKTGEKLTKEEFNSFMSSKEFENKNKLNRLYMFKKTEQDVFEILKKINKGERVSQEEAILLTEVSNLITVNDTDTECQYSYYMPHNKGIAENKDTAEVYSFEIFRIKEDIRVHYEYEFKKKEILPENIIYINHTFYQYAKNKDKNEESKNQKKQKPTQTMN